MALCLIKENPENGCMTHKLKRKRKRKPTFKRMYSTYSSNPNAEKRQNEGINIKPKRKRKSETLRIWDNPTYSPRHSADKPENGDLKDKSKFKNRTKRMLKIFSKRAERGERLKIDIPISRVHLLGPKFWHNDQYIVSLRSKYSRFYQLRPWEKKQYEKDFEELKIIGGGAFGKVYKVKKRVEYVDYAVKKVKFSCEDNLLRYKVLKEVKCLEQLSHSHVVRYKKAWIESASGDAEEFSDSSSEVSSELTLKSESDLKSRDNKMAVLYIQMELCERSLQSWLDDRNGANQPVVDVKESTEIFEQIVKGVCHIHSKKLMHRDLKPQNILFDFNGRIKIGDFGLGKAFYANKRSMEPLMRGNTRHSSYKHTKEVGTIPYVAPEVATETNYDFKVDMYSLGVILLELFCPFKSGMERCKVLENLKLSTLPKDFEQKYPDQAKMILKLTASDPNIRPKATEVLNSMLFVSKPRTQDKIENQSKKPLSVGGKHLFGNAKSKIKASKPRNRDSPSSEIALHSAKPKASSSSAAKLKFPCRAKSAFAINWSKRRKRNHKNKSKLEATSDKVTD